MIGIFDIRGKELSVGDRVCIYVKRFVNENLKDPQPWREDRVVDISKEKPLAFTDTPIVTGTIYYEKEDAAFKVIYDKPSENGISIAFMSNSSYYYEIL